MHSSRFFLLGAVFSSVPWQRLGSMKVKVVVFSIVVVIGSIRDMHFCCLSLCFLGCELPYREMERRIGAIS